MTPSGQTRSGLEVAARFRRRLPCLFWPFRLLVPEHLREETEAKKDLYSETDFFSDLVRKVKLQGGRCYGPALSDP